MDIVCTLDRHRLAELLTLLATAGGIAPRAAQIMALFQDPELLRLAGELELSVAELGEEFLERTAEHYGSTEALWHPQDPARAAAFRQALQAAAAQAGVAASSRPAELPAELASTVTITPDRLATFTGLLASRFNLAPGEELLREWLTKSPGLLREVASGGITDTFARDLLADLLARELTGSTAGWPCNSDDEQTVETFFANYRRAAQARGIWLEPAATATG